MRILFICGHLHVGGVEKSLINLLQSLDYTNIEVDLLLLEDLGEYLSEVPERVKVIYWDLKPTYGSVFGAFSSAIKEKRAGIAYQKAILTLSGRIDKRFLRWILPNSVRGHYDCAIAYRVGMPLDLVAYAVRAKKKLVWWHHGEFDYSDSTVKNWHRAFERVDNIVCVSQSSLEMIKPYFPGLERKMCVIPNMIIPESIRKAAGEFNPYANAQGKTILVSVGRMSKEKHMIDAVEVMRELMRRGHENILWYLVGDGIQRQEIENRIREYGLESNFVLTGNQANPYPYIKNADLFVHPSWVESQGICVLEAMALEKPCVVVRSTGTMEYVEDGINAVQADNSATSLADRVQYAIEHLGSLDFRSGERETIRSFLPEECVSQLYGLMRG